MIRNTRKDYPSLWARRRRTGVGGGGFVHDLVIDTVNYPFELRIDMTILVNQTVDTNAIQWRMEEIIAKGLRGHTFTSEHGVAESTETGGFPRAKEVAFHGSIATAIPTHPYATSTISGTSEHVANITRVSPTATGTIEQRSRWELGEWLVACWIDKFSERSVELRGGESTRGVLDIRHGNNWHIG